MRQSLVASARAFVAGVGTLTTSDSFACGRLTAGDVRCAIAKKRDANLDLFRWQERAQRAEPLGIAGVWVDAATDGPLSGPFQPHRGAVVAARAAARLR